jgi:hypothetical protein
MSLRDRIKAVLAPIPVVGDEDEFDPFAPAREDPPPEGDEGDDSVHAETHAPAVPGDQGG